MEILAPRGERVVERAFSRRALFNRDDGAALVGVDQRHVEPRTLLQELQIAGAVGIDVGEADQEEAVGDLHRETCQRRAARLLVGLHQDARHVADAAAGKILRQDESQFGGVARGQRGVGVAAERHRHLELAVGNYDVGAHGDVRLPVAGRLDRFGAPDHRADILLALGIARILVRSSCRSLGSPSSSSANLKMVESRIWPLPARATASRSSATEDACFGLGRPQATNVLEIWSSRSIRSVRTRSVGFSNVGASSGGFSA